MFLHVDLLWPQSPGLLEGMVAMRGMSISVSDSISFPSQHTAQTLWHPEHSIDPQILGPGYITQWMNQTANFLGLRHGSLITFSIQNVQGLAELLPQAEYSTWGKTQAASSGYQKDRLRGVLLGTVL